MQKLATTYPLRRFVLIFNIVRLLVVTGRFLVLVRCFIDTMLHCADDASSLFTVLSVKPAAVPDVTQALTLDTHADYAWHFM